MRDLVRRGPPGPVGDSLRGIPGVVDGPFGSVAVGLKLASTGDHAITSANWSETILYSQVRLRLDEDGANALAFLAGCGTGGGVHSFVGAVYASQPSATRSRLSGFHGAYVDPSPNQQGIITDELVARGRYITMGYRLISGVRVELWVDGSLIWTVSTAATSLGVAQKYAINRRPSDLSFNFGAMTWVESQASTAVLSDSEIIQAHAAAPGTALPQSGSMVHWLSAADCGSPGGTVPASINDRVSGKGTLAITSAGASIVAVPMGRAGLPPIEVFGDSKWAGRRADTTLDGGPRRYAHKRITASRYAIFCGTSAPSFTYASTPLDFDAGNTCVGGMGLGATPGGGTTRLSTVATDRGAAGGTRPDGITSIAMGVNDLYRLCNELGQSSATALTNLQGYFDSEISGLRVVRTTGPIVVHTIAQVGTGHALNANGRAALAAFNSGAAAMVATLTGTYGEVYLFDEDAALVAAFGSGYADGGVALQADFIHYTDAANQAVGNAYADFLTARF